MKIGSLHNPKIAEKPNSELEWEAPGIQSQKLIIIEGMSAEMKQLQTIFYFTCNCMPQQKISQRPLGLSWVTSTHIG